MPSTILVFGLLYGAYRFFDARPRVALTLYGLALVTLLLQIAEIATRWQAYCG